MQKCLCARTKRSLEWHCHEHARLTRPAEGKHTIMKFQKLGKSTILAATVCLGAISPALGNTTTYEYDWVQSSGSPSFSGYLLLDAASGNGVAASTATILDWNISDGSTTFNPSDSTIDGGAFLTWGSIGGGVSQITSISPTLLFDDITAGSSLVVTADSLSTQFFDPPGGFYLNGVGPASTVPDVSNTAVLLWIVLAGLAGFNLRLRRARRSLPVNPASSHGCSGVSVSRA